jgi:hypothetical protein
MKAANMFFFERKNQETFANFARALPRRALHIGESFCLFCQKEGLHFRSGIK